MRIQYELTREDLARVTSKLNEKERYVLGIGAVLDGVIWPGMVGTPDHTALLSALHRLRLVCVPDELVSKHRIVSTIEDPAVLLECPCPSGCEESLS